MSVADPAAVTEDLAAGTKAGDYVIDGPLGSGAMGEVYAGHHPVIGKRVAIKVVRPHLATAAQAMHRLLREARAVNRIDHPNVVDVFALGRLEDGRLFLVMDHVEGTSLRARTGAPVPDAEVLAILTPIAAAVDAAHERGVVHRDLKPDNVMVSGDPAQPTVRVLDFGIAKLLAPETGAAAAGVAPAIETLTSQGAWLGTPAYMAPEQWSADGAVPASDRYALGIIAYELLAGAPPFHAASLPALMELHFRATPAPLGRAPVDAVLATALAKDPERRFSTAASFVAALRLALADPRAARRAWRRGPLLGGATVGVLGAGVWVVASARTPATGAPPGVATRLVAVDVTTTPSGARVFVDGRDVGATPTRLRGEPGEPIAFELRKPGYVTARRAATPDAELDVTLATTLEPVAGFEGTWLMPSGELRRFTRDGESVVAFRTTVATDPGTYYRRFEFIPSDGNLVVFAAEEEHVDERAPEEPSCHVPLQARYEYDPTTDALELTRERAAIELHGGRCVVMAHELGAPAAMTRVGPPSADVDWTESTAGTAAIVAPEPTPVAPPAPRRRPRAKRPPTKTPPNARDAAGDPLARQVVDPSNAGVKNSKTAPPTKAVAPPAQQKL